MSRFRIRSPQVIHETLDGEVVIVNLETGNYYQLKDTGERIWSAIARGAPVSEILGEMVAAYDEPTDADLENAVPAFLSQLTREGLIIPCDEPAVDAERTGVDARATPTGARFTPPVLRKFEDMQELILLDPVHEFRMAPSQDRSLTA